MKKKWHVFWRGCDAGLYGVAFETPTSNLQIASSWLTKTEAIADAEKRNNQIKESVK